MDPASLLVLQFGGGTMPTNSWLVPRKITGDVHFHLNVEAMEDAAFLVEMESRSRRIVFADDTIP